MAGLEARLSITATDQTSAAFAALKSQIAALDKQVAVFDSLAMAAGKVGAAADPLINSISKSTAALTAQKAALTTVSEGLAASAGSADSAVVGQRALASATEATTSVMIAQGAEAARVAGQLVVAQRRATGAAAGASAAAGKGGGGLGGAGMLFAPLVLAEEKKAIQAGMKLEEAKAALRGAGVTPQEIAKFSEDYREFVKTHPGLNEAEYLQVGKEAYAVAPKEPFAQAKLGAEYLVAARNSQVPVTEDDIQNVLKVVDEYSPKTQAKREDLLNWILKSQQFMGGQMKTETLLAATRAAKQTIYGWDDDFRYKYWPTLVQSLGVQAGTAIETTVMNYVGGHMQTKEFKALMDAGFVRPEDVQYIHHEPVLKKGAHLFEADVLRANPAQWAIDFHAKYMSRKGATEGKFKDLLAKMPRNMSDLIAFSVEAEEAERFKRDAAKTAGSPGLFAGSEAYLAQNPSAALGALTTQIAQFGAALTDPAIKAAGPQMVELANFVAQAADIVGTAAKKHPRATEAGLAAVAVEAAWESAGLLASIFGKDIPTPLKMLGKVLSRWFGRGGGAAGAEEAAAAGGGAGAGGGLMGFLTPLLGALGAGSSLLYGEASGQKAIMDRLRAAHPNWSDDEMRAWAARQVQSLGGPRGMPGRGIPPSGPVRTVQVSPSGALLPMHLPGAAPASPVGTRFAPYRAPAGISFYGPAQAPPGWPPGGGASIIVPHGVEDPAQAAARAMQAAGRQQMVGVTGAAQVDQTFHFDITLNPRLEAKLDALDALNFSVLLAPTGVMDTDARPQRSHGGIGRM